MEKALVNFFYLLLIRSAESHYGESFVSVEVPSNSIKSFSWFQKVLIFKFLAFWTLNNLLLWSWLIISIAKKDEVVNLALKEDNWFFKLMKLNHFNSNEDDVLMSIIDLRALRLRKQKIKSEKKQENTSWI